MKGLFTDEKSPSRITAIVAFPRWLKVVFFLFTMLLSLLLFSAPVVLLAVADAVLPAAVFSTVAALPLNFRAVSFQLKNYDFRSSLIDVPLLSLARSALILCVYGLCDGPRLSRGSYLAVATACSAASMVFVSLKAAYMFVLGGGGATAVEAGLLVASGGLAMGHVAVAYRISCRERRKLLVYKIDIEAVSSLSKTTARCKK